MAGRQVTIQFIGDAKSLIAATSSAGKSTTTLGDKLKRVGKAAVIGFAGAAVVASKAMYDMAEAAIDDQKSATLLANSLKNTTGATNAQVGAVEDWISKQGELYGVMDDDLRPALQKLGAATGSIAEAQKDASLAMDVAAGSGKSLSTISQTLAKAISTGSVTALGKFQVATKNADGSTKSLSQVTDELAKKYKGSAAAAADTAAGKFQRLKLDLSETAEAIGYKLLPVADDLGSWLLKDGVPAVEHLAHSFKQELGPVLKDARTWVSDNKDELHDLGKEVVDVAIPAIRDLGGFVGDAFGFFSRLPGPIKSVGIEAGVAAIAIPKLSAAIQGVTSSVGLSTGKLAGWRKGLLLAAGVGGIGAIEEGARTGNKAVSLFGDAMTGAFVGGTLGSAIPGVGTAIGAVGGAAVGAGVGLLKMHHGADAAGDSAKSATPDVKSLGDSLNQVTGAATRATKALILQKLEEDGLVDSATSVGIATSDMIKATLGNEKAVRRINEAYQSQTDVMGGLQASKIQLWVEKVGTQFKQTSAEVARHNAILEGTDRAAKDANKALSKVGGTKTKMDDFSFDLLRQLDKAGHDTDTKASGIRTLLSTGVGKARANMGPFGGDLARQLGGIKGNAHSAGVGIGNSIESGVHSGLGSIISNTVATIQAAINAAQAAASHHGGGGGGKGAGKTAPRSSGKVVNLDDYRMSGKRGEIAGSAFLIGIVKGIKKGDRDLKHVMAGVQSYIKTKNDALQAALDTRSGFVQSFRDSFSESIFSSQNTDSEGNSIAPTLASMKAFAAQQQSNAHALAANVKSLLSKGLSKDLINQLIGQGSSGAEQIAALATGTAQDIAEINAANADTNATLQGLGKQLYDALNPGAEAQIDLLQKQVDSANRQEALLQRIADSKQEGEIKIKGTDLVITIRKVEQQTGKKLFVASA